MSISWIEDLGAFSTTTYKKKISNIALCEHKNRPKFTVLTGILSGYFDLIFADSWHRDSAKAKTFGSTSGQKTAENVGITDVSTLGMFFLKSPLHFGQKFQLKSTQNRSVLA